MLYKITQYNPTTKILIWKITESFDELFSQVILKEKTLDRLQSMKSEVHKRAFLSVRKLLQESRHNDLQLHYDQFGKPHLENETHISITHSFDFSAIILSDENVGIDIELRREKIILIANKFVDNSEFGFLDKKKEEDYVSRLTVIWGVKEAIFKIRNEKGISFKDHIFVAPFEMKDQKTKALLTFGNLNIEFDICFEEIENYTLVYAFQKGNR
ncbi:phosphopantetheinyl transferase [Flavobacterium endophyticum]|uniref:Phosphopantetheinyl transferase n=1 Tax=Flavobacterium endophyticum TaxID=1540163 RepID=A0A495MJ22_9FLAO|nr:4'-phosphopantetheinyl transferase superfamily protein [Flavobacterium endophyticum]RKS25986.1 phosphopantetheinyl transferase [Flavobacterium endophyticum]